MEIYARVRRAVLVEGKSRRAVAREFGLARKTISKMLEYSLPPGYRRQKPVRRPKLAAVARRDRRHSGGRQAAAEEAAAHGQADLRAAARPSTLTRAATRS